MTRISIIVPVRDGAATLAAQLDALVAAAKPRASYEVLIADNGSTDHTVELARSYEGRLPIEVVDASDATGANVARNRGVAASTGELILFCDADDEVDATWLTSMEAAFEAGSELVAGPIDYRRLNPDAVRAWRGATRAGIGPMVGFLPAAHTANLGVTRRVFDEIGGFDEAFRHGGDDIEFIWRAQLAGHVLTEVPGAVVHYRLRSTLRDHWKQSVSYGSSEALLFTKFRDSGMRRRSLLLVVGDIWWLVSRLPFAAPVGRRGAWLRRLGEQVGRLRGAWSCRTPWW